MFSLEKDSFEKILKILLMTTDPKSGNESSAGVFFYQARGEFGEEPGELDLLAGMSNTGTVFGATAVPLDAGKIPEKGVYIPTKAASTLMGFIKTSVTEQVVFEINKDENDSDFLLIYDHDCPESKLQIPLKDPEEYPYKGSIKMMSKEAIEGFDGIPNNHPINKKDFSALLKVASAFKSFPVVEFGASKQTHRVSIGEYWRGAIVADEKAFEENENQINAELYEKE